MRRKIVNQKISKYVNSSSDEIESRLSEFLIKLRTPPEFEMEIPDLPDVSDIPWDQAHQIVMDHVSPDKFAEMLKAATLSLRDKTKIKRRAGRFLGKVKRAMPEMKDVTTPIRDAIISGGWEGMEVHGVTSAHEVDVRCALLHEESPWMAKVSAYIMRRQRKRAGAGFHLPPILLVGPPGGGKTHYCQRLADVFWLPFLRIDAPSEPHMALGLERGWGSSRPSAITQFMLENDAANPLILIDEIDKIPAAESEASKSKSMASMTDRLLAMLEPTSARSWRDPCYQLEFDLSMVNWIFTANDIRNIPQPFLSRCQIFRLDRLNWTEVVGAVHFRCQGRMDNEVMEMIIRECTERMQRGQQLSLRDVHRLIDAAEAALDAPVIH